MKIRYINARRMYYAFLAGGNAVIKDKDYLNRINVFPVPDADTGTNLASTMRSIAETAVVSNSLPLTLRSIADAALSGARGNSGLIFAQFIHGFSASLRSEDQVNTRTFAESVRKAVQSVYRAIRFPVEGTMLTVMREWADALHQKAAKTADFVELLSDSLHTARMSLLETPKKLSVLARAGVVDAGAKGFVDFIEGVFDFTKEGRLRNLAKATVALPEVPSNIHSFKGEIKQRYCAEALLHGENMDLETIRNEVQAFGESAIVAGSDEKIRFHIHTNSAAELFFRLKDYGSIVQIKVDDMIRQYEASHNRKWPIALVADSACDIPPELFDEYQIHMIPFNLSFGETLFLDKVTITPEQFYRLLKTSKVHPKSSQSGIAQVQNLFSFLSTFYESILVFNISEKLSGAFSFSQQAAENVKDKKISVINSKNLSVSQGLIVLRAALAIRDGAAHGEIVRQAEEWMAKTKLLVDIATLKYMVRGGRISRMKGLVARMLNLKPLVTLDEEGSAQLFGKSFSRSRNMKKILRLIKEITEKGKIWDYAIVHAQNLKRAQAYERKIREMTGYSAAYIMDVSPVIGVHIGIGVVGIAVMLE